jgi:SAM-dependent methyltransferase
MRYESDKPETVLRRHMQGLFPPSGKGIDVGAGREPSPLPRWWEELPLTCRPWDLRDGDAHDLAGVPDESLDWLFSSHCLEHLKDPERALRNWVRVVKFGGSLLIAVPHRDLYEKRRRLPSQWNPNHRRFYLPFENDGPDTVGLFEWLAPLRAKLGFSIETIVTGDWGYQKNGGLHPSGEYQIDALLLKGRAI